VRYLHSCERREFAPPQEGGPDVDVPFRSRRRFAPGLAFAEGPGIGIGSIPATSNPQRFGSAAQGHSVFGTSTGARLVRFREALDPADRESIDCPIGDRSGEAITPRAPDACSRGGADVAIGAAAASVGRAAIRRSIDAGARRRASFLEAAAAVSAIEPS
jgi:hypothetical protein